MGKLIERWILQEKVEGTIEGVMDGYKRWIRAMEGAKDATRDESMEGAMDATSDGSGNN